MSSGGVGPDASDPAASARAVESTNRYLAANRANWDERVEPHLIAYRTAEFAADPVEVSGIVRFDASELAPLLPGGTIQGLHLVHLQCHIGTDTLSWARLGARVTGLDFSPAAIAAARELAVAAHLDATFVESTVAGAREALDGEFDVVYTSVGVLPWLPDLDEWARSIRSLLRPGGVFYIRETHPILNALDQERDDQSLVLEHPYFAGPLPSRYDDGTSYASDDIRLANRETFEWPHSLAEIVQALLDSGLTITSLREFRTIDWQALPWLVDTGDGWTLPDRTDRVPLSFSLSARLA